ncbi:MAG: hypothetical protein ABI794_09815 [Betaproteobacteria bacterium]
MPAREILFEWLGRAAARAGRQHWLHDGAWGVAAMLALVACHAALVRTAPAPAVIVAARPLLLLAALAIVVGIVARRWRGPDLAQVAAAADARAGLHDELISAHWFATAAAVRNPFVELHVERAARCAGRLDVDPLFPLHVPRGAVCTALVALIVGVAAWSLPPGSGPLPGGAAAPTRATTRASGDAANVSDRAGAVASAGEDDQPRALAALWKQLETLTGELARRPEGQSLAQAIAARDARAAARALRAARKDTDVDAAAGAGTGAPGEQMSDALAQDILARLTQMLKTEESPAAARASAATESERPTARLDRELRADQEDAQRSAPRQQSPGEEALNTALRALSRSGTGGRDAVHGEADVTQGGGRASVGGGAMGRRIGESTAGAGEGDQPVGDAVPAPDDDAVLGRKTERLAAQLRAVKVTPGEPDAADDPDDAAGTEESLYAATRAQAVGAGFAPVPEAAAAAAERAVDTQRSPLEFRDAVKRYTLARHRREAEAAGADAR